MKQAGNVTMDWGTQELMETMVVHVDTGRLPACPCNVVSLGPPGL